MARKKTVEDTSPVGDEKPKTVRLMSRKEFPIILDLKDGSKVKLTKNKQLVIPADKLPDKLPPGVFAY